MGYCLESTIKSEVNAAIDRSTSPRFARPSCQEGDSIGVETHAARTSLRGNGLIGSGRHFAGKNFSSVAASGLGVARDTITVASVDAMKIDATGIVWIVLPPSVKSTDQFSIAPN
ncbi:hypothetical protein Enr13x_26510 [Stieleria neptunia]|uniref:Uncharacterized protein n=1 Tax=Stieleria neptunia TaxID=2527979 RepID=A0A518HPP4_9BACT|nr:hypothetical protein Enr13x_26510 [Stieleria neptunia]